ncbi:MAG: outer membrane protein assembly factor BamD [Gammaproteobacteria bacterium]|nr:outer membrane protein assembly factor BamD [Gammaproteobacteria bacterium]
MTLLSRFTLAFSLGCILIAGCSSTPEEKDKDETTEWTAEHFYKEARSALDGGDYETAIKYFEKLETRFPFGRYAQQSQLETAYAYYKSREVDSSVAASDRFIKLHPTHPNVDYAYYLKGLATFQEGPSTAEKMGGKNPTHMDPGLAKRSYDFFGELLKKFPDSKYSPDARQRMVFLRNLLAQHEFDSAQYYLRHGVYVAAANRAKFVVEHYPRTATVADALALMARAYHELQMDDLARDSLRILELNFPQNRQLGEIRTLLAQSKL